MGRRKQIYCLLSSILFAILTALIIKWILEDVNIFSIKLLVKGFLALVCTVVSLVTWDISHMSPGDSHDVISLITQYLFIKILILMGISKLKSLYKTSAVNRQSEVLKDVLTTNCETEFGKQYKFSDIHTLEEYRRLVPLQNYDDYRENINRIKDKGTQNIYTKDNVIFLATTSGTTGQYKLVPITNCMKYKQGKTAAALMYYSQHRKVGLNLQRIFTISYKPLVRTAPSRLVMAPVSHHMNKRMPFVLVPHIVKEIDDEQTALYVHAVFGFREKEVGSIELLMSTLMYSFWRLVEERWCSICDDIEQGHLGSKLNISQELRKQIDKLLIPDGRRASELRKIFTTEMIGVAKRIWPNCRSVRMLTTGSFSHYAQVLVNNYMKGITQVSLAHAGSEAIMGINLEAEAATQYYTLMVSFSMFEFIPEDKCHEKQPQTILLHELEVDKNYELVITTPMGLYRYRMGDVVKIIQLNNGYPVYQFQYRLGQILNLFWEKTPENIFYNSVNRTVTELGVTLHDYTAVEDIHLADFSEIQYSTKGGKKYVLFIELSKNGHQYHLMDKDADKFDSNLCDEFEFYKSLRAQNSIANMHVIQVQIGTFLNLRNKILEKTQNQQFKMPRVLRSKEHLEYLLNNRL